MSDGPLPESTCGVDSSPEAIAATQRRLIEHAQICPIIDGAARDAAALLAQVARERDEARATLAKTRPLLIQAVSWQEYAERMEREADAALAEEVQRLRREKPAAERQLAEARDLYAVISRACGNWREWPGEAETDHDHPDWKAAARAIIERDTASRQLAEARAALSEVKRLVCGDRAPHWQDDYRVTITRGHIADVCDGALLSGETT